jgi:hypothetical protein
MKKLFSVIFGVFILTGTSLAQGVLPRVPNRDLPISNTSAKVEIISRKRTFQRTNKQVPDYKKTFTVELPIVIGLRNRALERKIEAILDYEKVFDFKVSDEIKRDYWLDSAGYQVNYNNRGVLDIMLFIEGSAAYPSGVEKNLVIDIRLAKQVRAADVFTNLAELAAEVKKAQQAEMKAASEAYKKDPDAADFDATEYFQNADFTVENLNEFSVDDRGVTFIYRYRFPHAALALEPEGRFFFSWTQLESFIRRDGLLGKFVR